MDSWQSFLLLASREFPTLWKRPCETCGWSSAKMDENLSISIGKQRVDVSVRAEIKQSGQLPSAYIQVTLHLSFNLYLVLLLVQGKQASLAKRLSAA